MKKPPNSVAIVGGGVSGLAAAYYLNQYVPSLQCHLYEKNPHLGGNIQSKQEEGFLFETGPDAFLHKPIMDEITSQLGLQDQLIETIVQNRISYITKQGKLVKIPPGFYMMGPAKLIPFLCSGALSLPTKVRTLLEPLIPAKEVDDESLAAFVTRRFGRGNLEEITQAMIGGIYTADPTTLSLQATLPRFIEFEKKYGSVLLGLRKEMLDNNTRGPRYNKFRSFNRGMQTLIDAMEASIPTTSIHKQTLVQSIDKQGNQWQLRINGQKKYYDYMIVAVPARATVHLCNFLPTEAKRLLRTIEFASSVIVHFGFERTQFDKRIDAMGMIVPHKENRNILASTFCSQKFPGRAAEDKVLLRVFMGGAMNRDICQESDRHLLDIARAELKDLLQFDAETHYHNIIKWPQAMPQYKVGHQKRVSQFFESVRNFEEVSFIGNSYSGVGIPDLIKQAQDTIQGLVN